MIIEKGTDSKYGCANFNTYIDFLHKRKNINKNSEVLILLSFDIFYLLLNCGALRAFLRPYFFLSFIRGSLVKNPFDFKAGLYS